MYLFGKNIKTSTTYNSAKPQPTLSAPDQKIQLDFAGSIIDDKEGKIYILVAIDRFSKYPSVMLIKTASAKKIVKFLRSYIVIMASRKPLERITVLDSSLMLLRNFAKAEA